MPKIMNTFAFISTATTILMAILYRFSSLDIFLTLAITFGTMAYHFIMRLLVGGLLNLTMNNHADYHKKWYQPHPFEQRLYTILKVKKWKNKLPTYQPELFSPKGHTFGEIAQAMCQAEICHEINATLSFLPLLGSLKFGSFGVFLITSIVAAGFDMLFVIMQRYNRPRIVKLAERGK